MKRKMRLIPLFYALFLIGGDCLGIGETADNHARILKAASSDPVPLNVYNWEDYIDTGLLDEFAASRTTKRASSPSSRKRCWKKASTSR